MEIIPKRDEACAGIPAEHRAPSKTGVCPYTKMGMVIEMLITVGSICVLGKVTMRHRHAMNTYGAI
jgi:hypothetical protein